MPQDSKTFEIEKPVQDVYRQWLNYENLADFAPFIKEVRKTGDRTSHWVAEAMGMRQEWDAEVTALEENRRIAWQSTAGLENSGEVLFQPMSAQRTRVTVNFEVHPLGGLADTLLGTAEGLAADEELDDATQSVKAGIEQR